MLDDIKNILQSMVAKLGEINNKLDILENQITPKLDLIIEWLKEQKNG